MILALLMAASLGVAGVGGWAVLTVRGMEELRRNVPTYGIWYPPSVVFFEIQLTSATGWLLLLLGSASAVVCAYGAFRGGSTPSEAREPQATEG
jgi:hypothetical protein